MMTAIEGKRINFVSFGCCGGLIFLEQVNASIISE